MDLSGIDQFFNTRLTKRQEYDAPFIGDAYNKSTGEFESVDAKEMAIAVLCVENKTIRAVVVMKDFSCNRIPKEINHIVVGVRVEIPKEGTLLHTTTVTWSILNDGRFNTETVNIQFKLGDVTIVEYEVAPLESFQLNYHYWKDCKDLPLFENLSLHTKEIETFAALNDKAISELNETEQSVIIKSREFLKGLSNVSGHLGTIKLIGWTWICETINFVKCNAGIEKQASALILDIEKIKDKYVKLKSLIKELKDLNIQFIPDSENFEEFVRNNSVVFCLNCSFREFDQKIYEQFLKVMQDLSDDKRQPKFVCVDSDRNICKTLLPPPTISVLIDGQIISDNYLKDQSYKKKNVARLHGTPSPARPKKRTVFTVECPGKSDYNCIEGQLTWICDDCQTLLFLGENSELYCNCGSSHVSNYDFCCAAIEHEMPSKLDTYEQEFEPLREINILILGESGVGKSTWINSIFNYVQFETLSAAIDSVDTDELLVPIPVRFNVTDSKMRNHEIKLGYDDNENLRVGASATQLCRSYSVFYNNVIFNLIDTPGIGDARGTSIDKDNIREILDHIKNDGVPHAICVLFKPNEARFMNILSHCITAVIKNMPNKLKNNLYFCFTNVRSTFYKPGETMPLLKNLVKSLKSNISLNANRVYCLDNEGFRYLCCNKNRDIAFTDEEVESFSQSWEKSVSETKKLLHNLLALTPPEKSLYKQIRVYFRRK